jgi:SnoaL-like domain
MNRREVLVGTAASLTATSETAVSAATTAARSDPQRDQHHAADSSGAREIADMAVIQNLLAGSALSADIGDTAYQTALYADDAIMDVGGSKGEIRGRDAIVSIITDASHSKLRAEGLAHIAAQPQIRVNGSQAVAVGYLQIMVHDQSGDEPAPGGIASSGKWVTWRLTANRWEFEFRDGRWQITRRTIRPAPSAEALELLRLA